MSGLLVTDEQRELVDGILAPLDGVLPLTRLRHPDLDEAACWTTLAELGWLGSAAGEEVGGVDLTAVECALMAERFGRALAPTNIVATIMAARILEAEAPHLSAALVAGEKRAAFGWVDAAQQLLTCDDPAATLAIVLGDDNVAIHEIREAGVTLGESRTLWSTTLRAVNRSREILVSHAESELAVAQLLLAAQASGIAAATRDTAVDYAKSRHQFGQPIGAFQAIKHRCADMALRALAATDLVSFASVAVADLRPDASLLASAALNTALQGARLNCAANIQIHGGMGFSDECVAHHYLKRARLLEAICGGLSAVRRRVLSANMCA